MSDKPHLIAITACPSGVAHTYMAAENLERAAEELGYTMDVETHGQIGIENAFSQEAINRAEAVIIAADSKIELDRFAGKRVVVKPNVREALLEATTKAQVLDELKAAVG
ncbi:MAG TPA: PTS fructose transporter subunit IIB [Arachnia sp.]|jgi:PTS system fructose-specific IIC component|nr:PTS fructose transporter subunit IIB [Arachnia sp.]